MLPLIPILIIGKLATAIPARTGALYESDLQEYLRVVGFYPEQHWVDSNSGLLTAFHTVLVLLQASIGNFDETGAMVVASFPPDFVAKDDQGNIIGGRLIKSRTFIENLEGPDHDYDATISNSFDKNYPIYLVRCFEQLSNLPADFQVEDCLSKCLKSVAVQRPECIKSALSLCQAILLSANLDEVRSWLNHGQPDPVAETPLWLKKHVGLDDYLDNQLAAVTDAETIISLREIRAMLSESGVFHKEMIDRLDWMEPNDAGEMIDQKNDIKEAVGIITEHLNPEAQQHWKNLQSALFGAVGWHIVNQARYAASQLAYLFKISAD